MINKRSLYPSFISSSNLIHGINSINSLKKLNCSRVAIIVGGSLFHNNELLESVKKKIKCLCIEVILKDWSGPPSIEKLSKPLAKLEESKAEIIIAIGGGSVIDTAKLLWMFYEHPEILSETYSRPFGIPKLKGKSKFICIPTTIGSGSEVSSSALLTDDKGSKQAIVTHDFVPDLVILDPIFVCNLPISIMISSMCDAISHIVEGYVSKINNPFIDIIAEKALQIILKNYSKILSEDTKTLEVLLDLQYASTMAGWVQNHCLVGLSHSISHQLEKYGIPHGNANSILLPTVVRFNAKNKIAYEKYEKLSSLSGVGNNSESIVSLVENIRLHGNYSLKISSYNNKKLNINAIAQKVLEDPITSYNPQEVNITDVKQILEKCL